MILTEKWLLSFYFSFRICPSVWLQVIGFVLLCFYFILCFLFLKLNFLRYYGKFCYSQFLLFVRKTGNIQFFFSSHWLKSRTNFNHLTWWRTMIKSLWISFCNIFHLDGCSAFNVIKMQFGIIFLYIQIWNIELFG